MPCDPDYSPPSRFAALEPERSGFESSRFVVLPVPYEQTTTFVKGTKGGPAAILRASREVELWDEDRGGETADLGIHTRPDLESCDSGPRDMAERVRLAVSELLQPGKIPIVVGGEHSISIGAVRALVEKHQDLTAVILDAHADLRNEYEGESYSTACTARRVSESCRVVHVGVRSMSAEEAALLSEENRPIISAAEMQSGGDWVSDVCARVEKKPVYLSIDLDVLDPSIMPSVGTPEPGGMGWYEVLRFVRELAKSADVVAFDVMELSPIPGLVAPDFLAAKLVYKIMGMIA